MSMDDFVLEISDYSDWHKEISSGSRTDFKDELFGHFLNNKYKRNDYDVHADRLYGSLGALKMFNFKPVFPLIFSYFKRIQYFIKNDIYKKEKNNDKLFKNAEVLLEKLEIYHFINYKIGSKKISFIENKSHIVPIKIGNPDLCKRASDLLLKEYKIYVQPINYPTVPRGTERLRVTPSPMHTNEMINHLVDSIERVWKVLKISRMAA